LLRKYARRGDAEVAYDTWHRSLVLERSLEHSGFELDREVEVLDAWGPELAEQARQELAKALAEGEAQPPAVQRNQPRIDAVLPGAQQRGEELPWVQAGRQG